VTGTSFNASRPGDRIAGQLRAGNVVSPAAGDPAAVGSIVAWPDSRFIGSGGLTLADTVSGPLLSQRLGTLNHDWSSAASAADPTQAWTIDGKNFGVCDIAQPDPRCTLALR
jgi:hypothetical protein